MNILEAYDLTGSLRDAAELAGCSHHTVARHVAGRQHGRPVPVCAQRRSPVIGGFLPKLEELVERSKGKIPADVAHDKITGMGYAGSERTTQRAVAQLKAAYRAGRRRVFRPRIPEPGMWAQYDFGDGPLARGRRRCCSACGWPGAGSGWCCRWPISPSRRCSRRSTWRCAGSAGCRLTC
jgi:hypothetical protein